MSYVRVVGTSVGVVVAAIAHAQPAPDPEPEPEAPAAAPASDPPPPPLVDVWPDAPAEAVAPPPPADPETVPASALPPPEPPPPIDPAGLVLPNLLSHTPGITVEVRGDLSKLTVEPLDDVTMFAFNAHLQYLSASGVGGYVAMPMYRVSAMDLDESGAGNLEVGALVAMRGSARATVLMRAAVAIDTANDRGATLAPIVTIAPRVTDHPTVGNNTTWARTQASLRHTYGNHVLSLAAGFDLPVDGDGVGTYDALLAGSAALGVQGTGAGVSVGLGMVHGFGGPMRPFGDATSVGLNATLDVPWTQAVRVFAGLGLNLDEGFGDLWSAGAGFRITAPTE